MVRFFRNVISIVFKGFTFLYTTYSVSQGKGYPSKPDASVQCSNLDVLTPMLAHFGVILVERLLTNLQCMHVQCVPKKATFGVQRYCRAFEFECFNCHKSPCELFWQNEFQLICKACMKVLYNNVPCILGQPH